MNRLNAIISFFHNFIYRIKIITYLTLVFWVLLGLGSFLKAYPIKVKDLTELAGVKKNFFSGYGLVTGLDGTGDRRSRFTQKSLSMLMQSNGIKIEDRLITTRNVASVMVTAEATGFLEKGDKVDVLITSMGDARSLVNGVLLPTSLKAGNGSIYLVASGILSLSASDSSPTRSVIPSGGVVERDFIITNPLNSTGDTLSQPLLYNRNNIVLKLKGTVLDNASRIKSQLEQTFTNLTVRFNGDKTLIVTREDNEILDHTTVVAILQTEIEIPSPRVVVIDQVSGIVVAGGEVVIEPSFISLQDLSLQVSLPSLSPLSQFGDFSFGTESEISTQVETESFENTTQKGKIFYTTVEELLTELQELNLDGYKIGSIFKALKKSGAINAEIIFQ